METGDNTTLQRLLRWKNRHLGEKCLLLCNGPSLNKVDFHRVSKSDYVIFGLNKIYLGFDYLGVKPRYIAAVNKKVLEQSDDAYKDLHGVIKFISFGVDESTLTADPTTFFMETKKLPANSERFSKDVVQYVREGGTVTHAALQIIYYMGFAEVTIVGMDHHFAQHCPGKENQTSVIAGDDIDHFDPNYFGNGKSWDLPDLEKSEGSYIAARRAFEERGGKIIDCSIGGACTIFEKRDIVSHLYTNSQRL